MNMMFIIWVYIDVHQSLARKLMMMMNFRGRLI